MMMIKVSWLASPLRAIWLLLAASALFFFFFAFLVWSGCAPGDQNEETPRNKEGDSKKQIYILCGKK